MVFTPDLIRIHYWRSPDRVTTFEQRLLERRTDCVVTLLEQTPARDPLIVTGTPILESGSPIVWFTFPGKWHDIGRFHLADGRFTGIYANILTPVRFIDQGTWETTDLFLDIWLDTRGRISVLDVAELNQASKSGWVDPNDVARARTEAADVVRLAERRAWPPDVVREWTLDRV